MLRLKFLRHDCGMRVRLARSILTVLRLVSGGCQGCGCALQDVEEALLLRIPRILIEQLLLQASQLERNAAVRLLGKAPPAFHFLLLLVGEGGRVLLRIHRVTSLCTSLAYSPRS